MNDPWAYLEANMVRTYQVQGRLARYGFRDLDTLTRHMRNLAEQARQNHRNDTFCGLVDLDLTLLQDMYELLTDLGDLGAAKELTYYPAEWEGT